MSETNEEPENIVVTPIDTAVEKFARGHAQSVSAGPGEEGNPGGPPDGENPSEGPDGGERHE